MEQSTVFYLVIGIIVLALVFLIPARLSPGDLLEGTKDIVPEISLTYTNGSVKVKPQVLGNGYLYTIRAAPRLRVTGDFEPVDVITIINFKGQSVLATAFNGVEVRDSFTLMDSDDFAEYEFVAEIRSAIPPIQDYTSKQFSMKQGHTALIGRGTDGQMLATASVSSAIQIVPEFDSTPFSYCRARFVLECRKELRFSSYFSGCTEAECRETLDLCGGEAVIEVVEDPDCSRNEVKVNLGYTSGMEWDDIGETVHISFWKDSECTRQTTDFKELLILCQKDRLAGELDLSAGLLTL